MGSLSMYRGDTETFKVDIVAVDTGLPLDLSGLDLRFTAKRKVTDADLDAVIVKTSGAGIELGIPTGEALITVDPADTDDLAKTTTLLWDVQVTDVLGVVKTAATGRLRILADVSRTTP